MERVDVEARIDNWVRRIEDLYHMLEAWFQQLPEVPNKQIFPGSVLQRDEALMQQFDVTPRMLPTRAFIYEKNRVSLVPSALWIIGANGRINLTVGGQQFTIVDLGEASGRSDWRIVTSNLSKAHLPFDQAVFNNLVLHKAIEAA